MDKLKEKVQNLNGGRILDIGTGTGEFLKELVENFESYDEAIGVDTNPDRIKTARENSPDGLKYLEMSAEKLDFEDDYFDTVAIRHSLHHMKNPDRVLAEMVRVLKAGGLMIICEVFQSPDRNQENVQRHIHHWWAEVDRTVGNYHGETFTMNQIVEMINPHGLKNVEIVEILEEFTEDEHKQLIELIDQSVDEYVKRLERAGDFTELIARGRALKKLHNEKGIIADKYLYVFGSK